MMTPDLYSFANLWRQYRICRRNKRNTLNQLRFEIDAERNLLALQRELRAHTYRPGQSICFVTRGPKPREVFAADFRDRIVHHLLVAEQERVFEPRFIHDSYACRVGKGTLAASNRLMEFLRAGTANGRRPLFALHLDVAGFFPSIDKEVLCALLARRLRHPEVRWLTSVVLFHDATTDYRFCSRDERTAPPGRAGYPVPARKSLFGNDNRRGLPIGNLTSQFWANVYLNEVDQFAKRVLRCRWYLRYVDDLMLLSPDPDELRRWHAAIARFLEDRLRLRLRAEDRQPVPVGQGVDFVGWKTWWSHRVPRRRTLANLRARVRSFERRHVARAFMGGAARVRVPRPSPGVRRMTLGRSRNDLADLTAALGSSGGHLRHGGAWRVWDEVWKGRPWLDALFARCCWRPAPRWTHWHPRAGESFRRAYARLLRSAPPAGLVFLQVGRFVELYGPQRLRAERVLGLRAAALPRAGYAFTVGVPACAMPRFAARALAAGHDIVQIRTNEDGACVVLLTPVDSRVAPAAPTAW